MWLKHTATNFELFSFQLQALQHWSFIQRPVCDGDSDLPQYWPHHPTLPAKLPLHPRRTACHSQPARQEEDTPLRATQTQLQCTSIKISFIFLPFVFFRMPIVHFPQPLFCVQTEKNEQFSISWISLFFYMKFKINKTFQMNKWPVIFF